MDTCYTFFQHCSALSARTYGLSDVANYVAACSTARDGFRVKILSKFGATALCIQSIQSILERAKNLSLKCCCIAQDAKSWFVYSHQQRPLSYPCLMIHARGTPGTRSSAFLMHGGLSLANRLQPHVPQCMPSVYRALQSCVHAIGTFHSRTRERACGQPLNTATARYFIARIPWNFMLCSRFPLRSSSPHGLHAAGKLCVRIACEAGVAEVRLPGTLATRLLKQMSQFAREQSSQQTQKFMKRGCLPSSRREMLYSVAFM